jgi:hypothetical protein
MGTKDMDFIEVTEDIDFDDEFLEENDYDLIDDDIDDDDEEDEDELEEDMYFADTDDEDELEYDGEYPIENDFDLTADIEESINAINRSGITEIIPETTF